MSDNTRRSRVFSVVRESGIRFGLLFAATLGLVLSADTLSSLAAVPPSKEMFYVVSTFGVGMAVGCLVLAYLVEGQPTRFYTPPKPAGLGVARVVAVFTLAPTAYAVIDNGWADASPSTAALLFAALFAAVRYALVGVEYAARFVYRAVRQERGTV